MTTPPFPEQKPSFDAIPTPILRKAAALLGAGILGGSVAYGGYSASASFILTLADGRSVFTKGSHPAERSHGAQNLRQEIFAYQNIPLLEKISPRFLGSVHDEDDNDNGWHLGFWDYHACNPKPLPLATYESLCTQIAGADFAGLPLATDNPYLSSILDADKKWKRLRQGDSARQFFLAACSSAAAGKNFLDTNLTKLCALQDQAAHHNFAQGLVHGDLRRDNFLNTPTGAYVIDWPNACAGPLAFDRVMLGADLGLNLKNDDDDILMSVLLAGYYAVQFYRDVPPAMPRLRDMQKRLLGTLLKNLESLGIIDSTSGLIPT